MAGDVAKWREYFESASRYSAVSRLQDIKQPVLLVAGERDEEGKQHMGVLQQGLVNDSWALIPEVKHILPTYAADDLARLMRVWLGEYEGVPAEKRPPDEIEGPHAWMIEERRDPGAQART